MLTARAPFTAWLDRFRRARSPEASIGGNPYNQDSPIRYEDGWIASEPYLAILNERITGDPALHWFDMVVRREILPHQREDQALLLLGSNEGGMEIGLRAAGFQGRIVASDIADKALARAQDKVSALGLTGIEHVVADLNRDTFPPGSFDVVIAEGVLHHVEQIDFCIANLRQALKPGGRLFAMEFVGAHRFQLPDIQVQWINAALGAVPRRYRPVPPDASPDAPQTYRHYLHFLFAPPSVEAMMALDPSEAVSGHLLLDAIRRELEIEVLREAGGGLVMFMGGHFPFRLTNTDPACADWLRIVAGIERRLYEEKIVPSDLVYLACRAREAT